MSIKDQLTEDMKQAMKAHNKVATGNHPHGDVPISKMSRSMTKKNLLKTK